MNEELAKVKPAKSLKFIETKRLKNNEIVNVLEEAILLKHNINDKSNYGTKNLEEYIIKLKTEINKRLENNKKFKIHLGE